MENISLPSSFLVEKSYSTLDLKVMNFYSQDEIQAQGHVLGIFSFSAISEPGCSYQVFSYKNIS